MDATGLPSGVPLLSARAQPGDVPFKGQPDFAFRHAVVDKSPDTRRFQQFKQLLSGFKHCPVHSLTASIYGLANDSCVFRAVSLDETQSLKQSDQIAIFRPGSTITMEAQA